MVRFLYAFRLICPPVLVDRVFVRLKIRSLPLVANSVFVVEKCGRKDLDSVF